MSSLSQEARQEVEKLLQAGRKLHAVKYLHDTFNVSLAEAKILTEAIEKEMAGQAPSLSTVQNMGDVQKEVERLLQNNQKIEAVKFVHQHFNTGLKEALTFVENIQQKGGTLPPSFRTKSTHRRPGFIWIFAGVAFFLFSICAWLYSRQHDVIKQGHPVEGVVMALHGKPGGTKAPVIAYQWHGVPYQYFSSTYTNPPAYAVAERVTLYVNPANPEDVIINSFSERWLAIIIVGGIGTVFAFFFILFYFVMRKF